MGNAPALAGFLLMLGAVSASPAGAQSTNVEGAYERLSPGNAKVARALYEAQTTKPVAAAAARSTGAAPAPKPLSLDQIAAMKQSGQHWGQVFQSLKAQGLVQDKNLGQVVSRYQQQHAAATGAVTTASNAAAGGNRGQGKGQ